MKLAAFNSIKLSLNIDGMITLEVDKMQQKSFIA